MYRESINLKEIHTILIDKCFRISIPIVYFTASTVPCKPFHNPFMFAYFYCLNTNTHV